MEYLSPYLRPFFLIILYNVLLSNLLNLFIVSKTFVIKILLSNFVIKLLLSKLLLFIVLYFSRSNV
ncbi:hypothetical protein C2G38_2077301 [Gigaspora rosea]|uniref:Uncharacterized protein n=1 Tax=Gigaspora rosea TaxID=44941 RepID=A0A397VH44_9GLOM|nr:hypothetical protein C2G38_2077301 [Gigaspora rosea]